MHVLSPLSLLVQEADIPQCILLFIWRKSVKDGRSCAFLKLDYGVAEAQILRLTWCHENGYNSWLEWNFWVRFVAACFVDIRDSEKHKSKFWKNALRPLFSWGGSNVIADSLHTLKFNSKWDKHPDADGDPDMLNISHNLHPDFYEQSWGEPADILFLAT